MPDWRLAVKRSMLRLGASTPGAASRNLRRTCDLIDCGRWLRENSLYPAKVSFRDRLKVFDQIAREVNNNVVLYLEFGVWEGFSMRYWSELLKNPKSMLHGFDSFEGLPEEWKEDHRRGRFAMNGKPPEISDERVKFFKGWFEETLPQYTMPPHEALVINIDCDLYSSTKYVLSHFRDSIQVGTWLYFDEFGSWNHECRAFRELVEDTHMKFELVAESDAIWSVAFRRTE